MKLQRTTILLFVTALLVTGIVFVVEIQGRPVREAAQAKQQQIFTFPENQVQSLKIITKDQSIEISQAKSPTAPSSQADQAAGKQPEKPESSVSWTLQAPIQAPANSATVAYLLSLLVGEKRDRTLKVAPADLAGMGLDKPIATVEITLTNRKTHRLLLGNPDFNGQFLYAMVDPAKPTSQAKEVNVALVPVGLQGAIDRPLNDWKVAPESPQTTSEGEQSKPEQSPSQLPNPDQQQSDKSDTTPEGSPTQENTAPKSSSGQTTPSDNSSPSEKAEPSP